MRSTERDQSIPACQGGDSANWLCQADSVGWAQLAWVRFSMPKGAGGRFWGRDASREC